MRIATFNTFWLGSPNLGNARRDERDETDLAAVLAAVSADVWVFQEVVSLPLLERLLDEKQPSPRARAFSVRDGDGQILTTGRMRSRTSHLQKTVLAYDRSTLELKRRLPPLSDYPGPRPPIVVELRHRASGFTLTVAGVHFKSGAALGAMDAPASQLRAAECESLLRSCRARGPRKPEAATDAMVVLGDFNAVRSHPSLDPLCQLIPPWTWHDPQFSIDSQEERWTSFNIRTTIDHALTSPAATARMKQPPTVYCYDLDPAFDRPPLSPTHFLRRRSGLQLNLDDVSGLKPVENLYRISDHRPLFIDLDVLMAHA